MYYKRNICGFLLSKEFSHVIQVIQDLGSVFHLQFPSQNKGGVSVVGRRQTIGSLLCSTQRENITWRVR